MRSILAGVAALAVLFCPTSQLCGAEDWRVTGMGGAGGMYTPAISPYDSNLMFLSCDMSGAYRSTDGGRSWQLIHYKQLRSSLGCRPAFTKELVFWAEEGTLKHSKDKGLTWELFPLKANGPLWNDSITAIAVWDSRPQVLAIGTRSGVWAQSTGPTGEMLGMSRIAEGQCGGIAVIGNDFFAAVTGGGRAARIVRWRAGRIEPDEELPVTEAGDSMITGFAAGSSSKGGTKESVTCLYAMVDNVGILKSSDLGKTWSVADRWREQRDVLVPEGQVEVAYAAEERGHEVWRTSDGGKTWNSIFRMTGEGKNVDVAWTQTFLHWDYSISHLGIGIDPRDADVVLMTSEGDFYRSNNGGESWFQCQNEPVGVMEGDGGFRFRSIGLEVTSLWGCYFDPNEPNRQYIAYTDIGFARSVDGGATWISAVKGCPWSNTYYEIVFDPYVKGRIYAACSGRHDIPHWTHIDANRGQKGGVCVSEDYGATWKVLGKGLPELPCTSIALDPRGTREKLTLYTTLYEGGFYKSTDGGATWQRKSEGLGNPGNMHAMRIRAHPKSGNLYCMITAFRKGQEFPVPGGLWKSEDGGETWSDITASHRFPRPTDFAVHPDDEGIIYINASTIPNALIGGIYKTTDGGREWKRVLTDEDFGKWCGPGYYEGSTVNLHPDDPDLVYVGTESHGLWYSTDAGKNWNVYASFPFGSPQNVAFDPADHKRMVVTTFGGGAWTGRYLPEGK